MNYSRAHETTPEVVLVYLGEKIPKYVRRNIADLKNRFPSMGITFIHDSLNGSLLAKELDVKSFTSTNWLRQEASLAFSLNHPIGFRDGFWFQTLARFFALAEFQKVNDVPIIQVECDVWLSSSFPIEKFPKLDKDIAFPMENHLQGSASILWLRNKLASEKLKDYAIKLLRQKSSHTDMTILGSLIREHPEIATTLPVGTCPIDSETAGIRENSCVFCRNFELFNGAFDALPYGMFLMGSDARNNRGWSYRFLLRQEHEIILNNIKFNCTREGILMVERNGLEYSLYNLHNHSKDSKLWGAEGSSYLYQTVREQRVSSGAKRSLDLGVFLRLGFRWALGKFRLIKPSGLR